MFCTIALGLVSVITWISLYWFYTIRYYTKDLKNVHGPKLMPIIGNALEFGDTTSFLPKLHEICRNYNGIARVCLMFNVFVCTIDYKLMEFVLSSNKIIDKATPYKFLHNWLGTGLLTSTGSKWRKRRKMITPAYHFQILEQFVDVFNKNGDIMVEKLRDEVGKGCTDVYPYVSLCTLDNICETAMGTSVHAQSNSQSEYVTNVKIMTKIMVERSFSAFQRYDCLYYFFPNYLREKRALKMLHGYTMDVIKARRESLTRNTELFHADDDFGRKKRVAFLDLLLQSTIDERSLTDQEIREEVDTFMFEGHDTTSSAISFAMYCLANNSKSQNQAFEEQKTIFGKDPGRPATYKDLQDMKYLELVIKETLRLYPSVPFIAREVSEDIKYDDDILFKKGTQITLVLYGIQRNEKYFSDPDTFKPERFSNENRSQNPYSFVPFSAGPRNCIGQKFAMLELKSTLSTILRNFELTPVIPAHQLKLIAETILKSDNGILVNIKARNWT